jgi:imidazolonepropionase-like amidohydrolase
MYGAAREQWPKQLALLNLLSRSHVLLTVGTDTPGPWIIPGVSFHQEMLLMRDAGLQPIDVLKCATSNAALALRQAGRIGTIAAGARADVVLLERNPLHNLAYTRMIRAVIKDGRFVKGGR